MRAAIGRTSNSSVGSETVSRGRALAGVLFGVGPLCTSCCPPLLMLACRANTTGGFLMAASVSSVALHWLCALSGDQFGGCGEIAGAR